jgi:hypothetical protein
MGKINLRAAAIVCLCTALTAAACSQPPSDPAGTTARIERSGTVVLGEVAAAPPSQAAEAVIARAAGQLGARVERRSGHGEELLDKLEHGQVDIVYGHFAKKSPWAAKVHLGEPIGRRKAVPGDEAVPRFAFRNGENGWIMRVERENAR